jgi:hypothetical protein
MDENLNSHHRATVEKLFSHPTSGNIEWHDVISLLGAVGNISEEHNGKVKLDLGGETEYLEVPRHKDIDQQMVVDLRRMLTKAGFAPKETHD